MTRQEKEKGPVLVTGATGYVAGWVIKSLLDRGITVHAAVRDPSDKQKTKHIEKIASHGNLKFFKTDLLDKGSYEEAMEGCTIVFHTASPFLIDITDPQKQLIDPAKFGTKNVLEQASLSPTVARVVVTSSVAAIYGDNKDLELTEGGIFTEKHWNQTSSLHHNPYAYSKTLAEKEAWEISKTAPWDLITINPSLVLGPGISPRGSSASFTIMKQLGDGTLKAGVPKWGMGVVDVRDVGEAHVLAALNPQASGRYIVSGHNTSFPELARILAKAYGKSYPIPRSTIPKFLLWMFGPLVNSSMTRKTISRNAGYPWKADNSKSMSELNLTYRPLSESLLDFFKQLIDSKQL